MVKGVVRAALASLAWRRPGPAAGAGAGRHSRCGHTHAVLGCVRQAAGEAAPAEGARGVEGAGRPQPLRDLLGRRHNYLRISLTERCNLRCSYCMPAAGVPLSARGELLTRGETLRLAAMLVALGVNKVRLTGGEPTLRADLPLVIEGLHATTGVRSVSMTTNGLVLTRQLPALQRAGLDALNVSLDSLRADRYERMARRPGLSRVLAGIDLALQLGYRPVKINTVLIKGFNDDEICDFAEFTRDRDVDVSVAQVHRVHAVRGQRVGGGRAPAVPRRAARAGGAPPRATPARAAAAPHRQDVAGARLRGPRRVHSVHDATVLLDLQPAAAHRRREPQGVPVRRGGGVAAGRAAGRRLRRGAAGASACRAAQQEARARRNEKPGSDGKSTDDSNRWVAVTPLPGRVASLPRRGAPIARRPALLSGRVPAREFCTQPSEFSHLESRGEARMVDVGHKPVSAREAEAECSLECGARLVRLLRDAALPKGDALAVARVAGVLAAKRTADLLPLCHPLPLHCVRVHVLLPGRGGDAGAGAGGGSVVVRCSVRTAARTGAEMEALTGAAVAALALYDMCKSVDKAMRITDLRVLRKVGGKSDPPPPPPPPATAPDRAAESYAPSNFVH